MDDLSTTEKKLIILVAQKSAEHGNPVGCQVVYRTDERNHLGIRYVRELRGMLNSLVERGYLRTSEVTRRGGTYIGYMPSPDKLQS